jgi:hypothetical protein
MAVIKRACQSASETGQSAALRVAVSSAQLGPSQSVRQTSIATLRSILSKSSTRSSPDKATENRAEPGVPGVM